METDPYSTRDGTGCRHPSSRRQWFCQQLADWLITEEWHFTTLLASCIESIKNLPDNADTLIHQLLLAFPSRPSKVVIANFLCNQPIVEQWFNEPVQPKIFKFNLIENSAHALNTGLPNLNAVADLMAWLNISLTQLDWLTDLKRYDTKTPHYLCHYHYSLAKKRDGSFRLIESPKSMLKGVQTKINDQILVHARVHGAAHGFQKGKSCKTHAALHTQKYRLFLFDLAHCFHSIQWRQIYRVFMGLGYSKRIAKYLTALSTHQCYSNHKVLSELDVEQQSRLQQRHLPQGAPSSPALSNAVLFNLDKRLTGLAARLQLDYSRYADDLTFSGNRRRDWRFFEPLVGAICLEAGFSLNYRKSRVVRPHQKQRVTGIVVNQKINIDRRYYDQLKATLNNCARYGLSSQNRLDHPDFRAHLQGCVQHVISLNRHKGEKLESIFNRIE